jgi:cytochrome c peroxidase
MGVKDLGQTPEFEVMGKPDKRPLGRGGFTGRPEDLYKFKTPQLYNLKKAKFYFHGASKRSLREVVEYFNAGQSENPDVPASQLSDFIAPLHLSGQEVNDIAEFLENGLYDPNIKRYEPIRLASGKCFPNNDPVSQSDLDCN